MQVGKLSAMMTFSLCLMAGRDAGPPFSEA